MGLPNEITELIERFDRNRDSYLSGQYNETQLRREFLDPFFTALGWDVVNNQGYAEAYKDVIHEDALKIGGATKAPDYCFRIGGVKKFFVEAKKPSVNLKEDVSPAFQLRRYAWSAKLPLSILTDFQEFAVYDCRIKPVQTDKASTGRVLYLTYKDYPARCVELVSIFSREALLKGSFDKYAESSKLKRGTATVDDAFLSEIEDWREMLARNIALRNADLTQRELNFAVQRTIDRIVFLRICEDRGIEEYGRLQMQLNGTNVYRRLVQLFSQADDRYNSGLFHFQRERDRCEEPDKLTPNISIDDKPLKDIIRRLYYPESPYEFSVLSADILGQVYEQFLGKVIRLTAGHQARVEEKPEVRKAGGVYYTPKYIVDYIVKNTVGHLVGVPASSRRDACPDSGQPQGIAPTKQNITPKDVSKIKILDPACGSGSFLLGAYQYLLDWHLTWYIENEPEKWARAKQPAIYQGPSSDTKTPNWYLTTTEKKRILLNNIYGVDIDSQAVEVTKLALLLKVLEGESSHTLAAEFRLFHQRALPDLGSNIKCGNSLIGPDFYNVGAGHDLPLFEDEERLRINVFDWEKEFPGIMKAGGFDAVIGNPPYVRQEGLGEFKDYFSAKYKVYHGTADLYSYFIERSVTLLRDGGIFGFIVANKWMRANYGEPLRNWIKGRYIEEITDFGDLPVFKGATTYPCILLMRNSEPSAQISVAKVKTLEFSGLQDYVDSNRYMVRVSGLDDKGWSLTDEVSRQLLQKLKAAGVPLGEYVKGKIYRGILSGLNEAFVIDAETREKLIREDSSSAEVIKSFLAGRDIKRYQTPINKKWLIFTRRGINIKDYPAIERHLLLFKERLMPKPQDYKGDDWKGRKPGSYKWYEIQDTIDYYAKFAKPKIIYAEIATKGQFTIDEKNSYSDTTSYIIPEPSKYLLAILNSKLWTFIFSKTSSEIRGGFFRWKRQYMSPLAIREIDSSNKDDKARHDKIVSLVDQMLLLNKRLPEVKTDHERTAFQRQIDATDRQIDQLVYELYGLTEEEIRIVEKC